MPACGPQPYKLLHWHSGYRPRDSLQKGNPLLPTPKEEIQLFPSPSHMARKEPQLAVLTWKKKKCTARQLQVKLYSGKMRTIAWETAFQITLRNCPKEVGGMLVYLWFWWRGSLCNQACIFAEGFCSSRGADVTMKEFSAFLDTRRCTNWAYKISSWKYLTIWRPVLPVFPEHRVPPFCSGY